MSIKTVALWLIIIGIAGFVGSLIGERRQQTPAEATPAREVIKFDDVFKNGQIYYDPRGCKWLAAVHSLVPYPTVEGKLDCDPAKARK